MSGFGHHLYLRTLGELGMYMNSRKLETTFPSPEAREIFLSLLSPLDAYVEWERLESAVNSIPLTKMRKTPIRKGVKELMQMFDQTAGMNLLREYPHGIGLDYGAVRIDVDAHDFRDLSIRGLKFFSSGDYVHAVACLEQALELYSGPFLPGDSGRIIDTAREELAELHGMINQTLSKARAATMRERWLIGKAVSRLKPSCEPFSAVYPLGRLPVRRGFTMTG